MHEVEPATIGAGRAKAFGFAWIGLSAVGIAFVLMGAIPRVDVAQVIYGGIVALSAASNAVRGFRDRLDVDEVGLVGRRDRRFARPRVTWGELIDVGCVGDGSFLQAAKVVATTTSGKPVTLLNYGIDLDAAETAVTLLADLRAKFDNQVTPSTKD